MPAAAADDDHRNSAPSPASKSAFDIARWVRDSTRASDVPERLADATVIRTLVEMLPDRPHHDDVDLGDADATYKPKPTRRR